MIFFNVYSGETWQIHHANRGVHLEIASVWGGVDKKHILFISYIKKVTIHVLCEGLKIQAATRFPWHVTAEVRWTYFRRYSWSTQHSFSAPTLVVLTPDSRSSARMTWHSTFTEAPTYRFYVPDLACVCVCVGVRWVAGSLSVKLIALIRTLNIDPSCSGMLTR